jgi:molybdopterin converting factor subunit 1
MMNHITLLFFATLRDRAGCKSTELEIPAETTVRDLKAFVISIYPSLEGTMETVVVSMNREFAFDENVIAEGAEVAMFPAVSGG